MNHTSQDYLIIEQPYYRPTADEVELFDAAYAARMPVMLKGPTGCGKTRFVEYMAWKLKRPLITVVCNEDMTASDLVGRFLLDASGTRWQDGPLMLAARIAAPAANRFGRVSPTRARHVRKELEDGVDMILEGGPCCLGLESTILSLASGRPRILRCGAPAAIGARLERSGDAHEAPSVIQPDSRYPRNGPVCLRSNAISSFPAAFIQRVKKHDQENPDRQPW